MKTPALLTKTGELLRRFASTLFGQIAWNQPRWLSTTRSKFTSVTERNPRLTTAVVIAVFTLSCGAAWGLRWCQDRPKPHQVSAKIGAIPVTSLEKDLKFPQLTVSFSESAARLEDLKKPSVTGVHLEPSIAGAWHWTKDTTLVFEPTEDWPADQKYRIVFDEKFFPPHVVMERLAYDVQTPPFAIAIKDLTFYQDPANPTVRQVTATLELTHAVEKGELEKHLQVAVTGGSAIFPASDPAPHFSLNYGLHQRLAYLRTSAITLPEKEDFLQLLLSKGVRTTQGGAQTQNALDSKITIPSVATAFQIDSITGTVARNKNNEPEQLLVLNTTADIATRDLAKAVEVWLLPKRESTESAKGDEETTDEEADAETSEKADSEESEEAESSADKQPEDSKWQSPTDVPDEVLEKAKRVQFTALPSDKAQDRQHVFRVRVESDGELYFRIRKGVRAAGDYPLAEDYNAVVTVPELPVEIQIEGQGGLLALNGERKLSVRSRGMAAIEYEVARVATSQINHLVSQTEGQFQHPHFQDSALFNEENISRLALEHQTIALENKWKANYSAFDFAEYLRKPADGGSERGLFFLTARGWDPEKKKALKAIKDRRFVLITDIGILTKKNADGSNDVFLMSIKNGKPISGASVEVLGKNGIALQAGRTDADGRCSFASVEKSTREKTPVAFVARNGDDISFIPYAREDRVLNFSRFDIEGVDSVLPENLDAFVFTERGVYRPGDEVHIALAVKQRDWQGHLQGLPLETEVIDARGLKVQSKKITLPEGGFTEWSFPTANESATGLYTFNVYLVKNSKRGTLLGSTTATLKEFLPDRMKIATELSQKAKRGWVNPKDMHASVTLANLYGTPASDRRVTGRVELAPAAFSFTDYRDFVFFDPLVDEKKQRHDETIDLGEKKTDGNGHSEFDLQLERFADATYSMQFVAEGFESEGGRSVTSDATALVSALPYVIGCKTNGDLNYIEAKKPRTIELIALDPQLNRIAIENITLKVIVQEYVSVLTKQSNGNYTYESVLKERVTKSEKIAVSANGLRYALPSTEPGSYVFELRDDQDRRLSKLQFSVVGQGAASRSLEKNAELDVKLDRKQYNSGDDIAVSITAPYAGNGLITIERDKVYAQQWFQANSASSVQHIRVPQNFEGSGYINVAFVRALDSKEIFVSPLSYGVVPFTANMEKRRLKIDLEAPAKVKPGEALHISYKTDRPGKIVIFAVDQGILQVTDYKTPDPLAFFFRKCTLGVETSQIVDLIIPEFSLLRSVSAFGGDGGPDQRLNPFKRVTDKPVVFWSGIVEAGPNAREVVYNVPDFFDGNLKIMAVAVASDATASTERDALVRGPFVVTPSVPVLAAPGDEFEAGVTVANNVEGSGADAEIELRAETNEQLSSLQSSAQKLRIAEGREQSAVFRFRANDKLGSGEIKFTASRNGTETTRRATISVRPPVPFVTMVRSGSFKQTTLNVPITRTLLPEFRKLDAAIAATPLGLAHGLDVFLKNFPHGCSEQITSGAFCRLLLADEADFGLSRAEINKQLESTFAILARRQNEQGAFGYWMPETNPGIDFISVYVMDFLSEAKAAGFAPPAEMFASGLRNLQKMVARQPASLSDARTVACAIYVLTREGVITTNYILNLRDYLDKSEHDSWENDATGIYLAGALKLLHKDGEAERLISQYKIDSKATRSYEDFYQPLGSNAQYLSVLAREFPAKLKKISAAQLETILKPIGDGEFNTLSAAYAVRALKSYSHAMASNAPELSITEIRREKSEVRLVSGAKLLQRSSFSGDAVSLRFQAAAHNGSGTFFQVIEAGYDRSVSNQPLSEGLEVNRELLDQNGHAVTSTKLGEPIKVRLHVRSLRSEPITNTAIIDLLPGGFEIVDSSLHAGASSIAGVDFVDLREDRAVFFATVPTTVLQIDYQIKADNRGEFIVPPVFAESMYDRNVKGRGVGGKIRVTQ